jgi:DNA-binding HxlR family transcriptional regulator
MESGFGQFCPVALASEVLTPKWTLLIIRELSAGSARFSDIHRGVPRMSATLLKQRLSALEYAGIVARAPSGHGITQRYVLTDAGQELRAVLSKIGEWGQRWARDIRPEDLDPGWLVWNMHRRLDTSSMRDGRTTIEIYFSDAPKNHRKFWLIHNKGNVEVCLKPPGFSVDVEMCTKVRVLAEIWRGIRNISDEIKSGRVQLRGNASLCRALPSWLLLSVYAPIKSARR